MPVQISFEKSVRIQITALNMFLVKPIILTSMIFDQDKNEIDK